MLVLGRDSIEVLAESERGAYRFWLKAKEVLIAKMRTDNVVFVFMFFVNTVSIY